MSYYDDLLKNIEKEIGDLNYDKALSLIDKELSMPYIPSNVETKLKEYLALIPKEDPILKALTDEQIISYLKADESKQLRSVDELNRKNIRDYLDICEEYLCSDGFINGKVLLIDSLIKQDINVELKMTNDGIEYSFIPKYVMAPETSLGFIKANEILTDRYMKEPSKLELAKQLLYKECLLALPINYEEDDAINLADKIYEYIEEAFK